MTQINKTTKTNSKARQMSDGRVDRLVTKTTQVYESQWAQVAILAKMRGITVAEAVREALDWYVADKAIRPKLISQLGALFKSEVSLVIGKHIQTSEASAREEIRSTQEVLVALTNALNTLIDQRNVESAIQRRELDQVVDFLIKNQIPIKRG